jgi:hypothetical protein
MKFTYKAVAAAACSVSVVGCIENDFSDPSVEIAPIYNPAQPPTPDQHDSYIQTQKPQVDILWVVDNSCSMADEQASIAKEFPAFFEFFLGSSLDYHIGVTSTDMDNADQSGKLEQAAGVRWITPDTPNPEDVFVAMSELGTGGSGNEEGILAGYANFELQDEYNAGFLRDDSAIHIIVVSDESDVSPNSPITLKEYQDYLNNLRAEPEQVTYNGIVSPAKPAFPCDGASTPGDRYIDTINAVGGVFWSRCNDDWSAALELMGLETAGLKREYFLTQLPVPGTIKVSVQTEGFTQLFTEYDPLTGLGDWTYSEPRNSVTFNEFIPESGSAVNIDYKVLSAAEHEE